MDTHALKKPLTTFTNRLPDTLKPYSIVVFGSYAQGKQSKDSDIDVMVVSEKFAQLDEDTRLDLLYKSSRFISPEIHSWRVTPEEFAAADPQSTIGAAHRYGQQFSPQK